MHVTFQNPGVEYMLESILEFQKEGESGFWSGPLYDCYPQLDQAYAEQLSFSQRSAYIAETMRSVYAELEGTIGQKVELYTRYWAQCRAQITAAFSDAFEVDCERLLNDITCNVSMNPIEPRYLKERRFDVFYRCSEKGAMGECIHELTHFVWFTVWNQLFGDSYEEYERPSMKWILSEMVVEPIMRDERLSSLSPFFPRENGGCVYPYFYDMLLEGKPILDTLDTMYRSMGIQEFMRRSYEYCLAHEGEIREHIRRAEG